MRMFATILLQPHVKGKLTPQKLLPFSWEKHRSTGTKPKISREEAQKRFKELVNRKNLSDHD